MKIKLLLLFFAFILLASRCKKGPDVLLDPCKDKVPFKADFTIEEKVGDTSFVTNKALAPGYVFFKAKGTYDSVRWFIGGPQNSSTNRNHVLYFQNPEGPVDVTFIGYKKPDAQCFPYDKAIDTVRKTVTILPRDGNAAIVGRFWGYNQSNPADTFSITISYYDNVWGYFIKNLPKGCPGYTTGSESAPKNIGLTIKAGYSGFQIDAASVECATVEGYGKLNDQDTLRITYSYNPRQSPTPYDFGPKKIETFIGIRKP